MKYGFLKSTAVAVAALAATMGTSPAAFAEESQYHGTKCMTANLAQGKWFN